VELAELEVGLGPARIDPEDLAAKGDGVVEKALVGVQVDCPLIGTNRLGGVVDLQVEIAYPVVE
jgi:hypothetical protein